MMFPVDYRAQVSWNDITADEQRFIDQLLLTFSNRLDALMAGTVAREGPKLTFEVPFFRLVSNLNLLVAIDKGEISVRFDERTLTVVYGVSFKRMLVVVTLMVLCLGGFMASQGLPWLGAGALVVGSWLWLFGMNVIIFLLRFRFWIKQTVQEELRWEKSL